VCAVAALLLNQLLTDLAEDADAAKNGRA
jgi:hypothetical protein